MFDQVYSFFQLGLFHVLNLASWDHLLFVIALAVPFSIDHWRNLFGWLGVYVAAHLVGFCLVYFSVLGLGDLSLAFLYPLFVVFLSLHNIFRERQSKRSKFFGLLFTVSLILGGLHGFISTTALASNFTADNAVFVETLSYHLGLFVGLITTALVTLLIGFFGHVLLRFSRRDWIIFVSALIIGLVLPFLVKSAPW